MRMWKLTDPSAPTYVEAAGSALDEFLFFPDLYIPSTFFEDFLLGSLGVEEIRGGRFFPATDFPHFAIRNPG